MSIVADQNGQDQWDYDFTGGSQVVGIVAGRHEREPYRDEPTATDANPGRFQLDPDSEDAMNQQVRQEVDRLRREVPDLRRFGITPGLYWSGDAESLTVDALPWKMTFFAGEGLYIGDGATLADAVTDGLDKYHATRRAKALDAVGQEGRAA